MHFEKALLVILSLRCMKKKAYFQILFLSFELHTISREKDAATMFAFHCLYKHHSKKKTSYKWKKHTSQNIEWTNK